VVNELARKFYEKLGFSRYVVFQSLSFLEKGLVCG
jgi:ribosomal protein S18 acetylase RimI-like enzyme